MYQYFTIALLFATIQLTAQINLESWRFKTGDDMAWAATNFDDTNWATIKGTTFYENQGYEGYNGYSWYRVRFTLPHSMRAASYLKDSVRIIVARVDDIDATYLNGVKIGGIGRFPEEPGGAAGFYDALRRYVIAADHPALRWDAENVIAVRVFDGGGGGGLWGLLPNIGMVDIIDFQTLNTNAGGFDYAQKGVIRKEVRVESTYDKPSAGTLSLKLVPKTGKTIELTKAVELAANGTTSHVFEFPDIENAKVTYSFSEKNTGKTISQWQMTPYILTPKESHLPKITNAILYGARPSSTFLWAIRATGARPMTFSARNLPSGLTLDPKTGIISGKSPRIVTDAEVVFVATNALGSAEKKVILRFGEALALTPPMGWNSWNCWGIAVSQDRVKLSADAVVSSGLVNHGWSYMIIDDGWQGTRDASGVLQPNEKFPKMPELGQYLHQQGMKFGIYSSPGARTCGGLAGSLDHETADAKTWANWGVDYLKYDWCSYNDYLGTPQNTWTVDQQVLPFRKMTDALNATGRDMLHSVCNWGMNDVWKWAPKTGGQLWRTTGDIEDSWASLSTIGFGQADLADYSQIGAWNDPDMLIVGWVGWGDKLHQTRLTPSEQYTHLTLWAMSAAPLLIGCDLSRLDAFTYNLLANDEVIAIDQDILGKQARCIVKNADHQIWVRELADGSRAVAVFNLADADQIVQMNWKTLGVHKLKTIRDVWRQKDLGKLKKLKTVQLEPHGCQLYIVR
jgi:alpha-galactosidase